MNDATRQWLAWDAEHCWHPFTDQAAWCDAHFERLVIERGSGVWLWDTEGRRYFDGNSSIWTNIHGHGHARLREAALAQLDLVAHTSYLGFANPRASELAARLCGLFPERTLSRVFYSDDGSTAVECALKMALQYRMQTGEPQRLGLVAFDQGYHGDTMGAAALGGVSLFFQRFRRFGMPVTFVRDVEELRQLPSNEIAAVILEPLIQGVNEMRPWPQGMLRDVRSWCDQTGVQLILDEVMTGFGRTGSMFACQQEQVIPDFLCLAKGLTAGYAPLAATMTTEQIYRAFEGPDNVFYYGHSYTAHQLGCALAIANLDLFEEQKVLDHVAALLPEWQRLLAAAFSSHQVRVCGLIAGVELRQKDGSAFPSEKKIGAAVCYAARRHGLLTRPIRDTVVLMPPLCCTLDELRFAIEALRYAIVDVLDG